MSRAGLAHPIVVDGGVIGDDEHAVGVGQRCVGQFGGRDRCRVSAFPGTWGGADRDRTRSPRSSSRSMISAAGDLTHVVDIGLVGDAEHQHGGVRANDLRR